MPRICRPWITTRDGRRLYAKDLGLKAICFWVDEVKPRIPKQKTTRRMQVVIAEDLKQS